MKADFNTYVFGLWLGWSLNVVLSGDAWYWQMFWFLIIGGSGFFAFLGLVKAFKFLYELKPAQRRIEDYAVKDEVVYQQHVIVPEQTQPVQQPQQPRQVRRIGVK